MLVDDAVTMLVDAGIAVRAVSLFWTSGAVLPPASAAVATTGYITIQNYGGAPPILMHKSDQTPGYLRPTAQIVARAKGSTAASALALRAWQIFVQRRNFSVGSVWYVSIDVKQSEPFDLGHDDAGLVMFAFNIEAVKRPI